MGWEWGILWSSSDAYHPNSDAVTTFDYGAWGMLITLLLLIPHQEYAFIGRYPWRCAKDRRLINGGSQL